jgi:hypothetical protein
VVIGWRRLRYKLRSTYPHLGTKTAVEQAR